MPTINTNAPAILPGFLQGGNASVTGLGTQPNGSNGSGFDFTGLFNGISSVLNNNSGGNNLSNIAGGVGSVMGGVAGTAIAGPIGGAIGSSIGGAWYSAIASLFGSGGDGNPYNDWETWNELDRRYGTGNYEKDLGGNCAWMIKEGNGKEDERYRAYNALGFIKKYGWQTVARHGVTEADLLNLMNRAGMQKEVAQLQQQTAQAQQPAPVYNPALGASNPYQSQQPYTYANNNNNADATNNKKQDDKNKWIGIAIVGVVIVGIAVVAYSVFKNKN